MQLKVTVCQLWAEPQALEQQWEALAGHVRENGTDLLLLPEMPFFRWFAVTREVDPAVWQAGVAAHDTWLARLAELAPAAVLGSRPVNKGRPLNEGFAWDVEGGYRAVHDKYYLPDEDGFWEATWYRRGDGTFEPVQVGEAKVGFQICSELWFFQHARAYGQQGIHLLVTPRATEKATRERWLTGGRVAAMVSGAYSLSSNHASPDGSSPTLGGHGWIITPDGEVLGVTSAEKPFLTCEIDLAVAERAKSTYPRYVIE